MTTTIQVPKSSPWGAVQSCEVLADGIFCVSTASHGGIKLDRDRNAKMPAYMRRDGGWYEEDCEWALVALKYPEAFDAKSVEAAHHTVKNWMPGEYMQFTGNPLAVSESRALQEQKFHADHAADWVVIAACGDWKEGVPKGMVECLATIGGERGNGYGSPAKRTFLVSGAEYETRERFGFVIDLAKHREVTCPTA
jgi:hypothetical protein